MSTTIVTAVSPEGDTVIARIINDERALKYIALIQLMSPETEVKIKIERT